MTIPAQVRQFHWSHHRHILIENLTLIVVARSKSVMYHALSKYSNTTCLIDQSLQPLILLKASAFVLCALGNQIQFKWMIIFRLVTQTMHWHGNVLYSFILTTNLQYLRPLCLSEITTIELLFTKSTVLFNVLLTVSNSLKVELWMLFHSF